MVSLLTLSVGPVNTLHGIIKFKKVIERRKANSVFILPSSCLHCKLNSYGAIAEPKEHVFYQAEWNGFFRECWAHPKMPEP